jgi:hypothetical protein
MCDILVSSLCFFKFNSYRYIEMSKSMKDVDAIDKAGLNKMTHRIQLTHSLKAPGDNP